MPAMAANDDQARREATVRDHLANERTLLAWQRTALAVVGIGFLVDRFALGAGGTNLGGTVIGAGLIVLGAVASLAGTVRFLRTEREIETQTYKPAVFTHLALTGAVVIAALMLAVFLVVSPD